MDKKKLFEEIVNATKVVGPAIITERVYESMFKHHFYTFKPIYFTIEDFPDLSRTRYTFYSCNKHLLVGYIYKCKNVQNKGIFVFSHGYGGGGHHCYLDLIHAICEQGYYVFAYDATACDESEGHDIKGFTQGMLDADKAISFIETFKEFSKLPLYLCGHSWGGYSVSTALGWHERVKGVIAFSGFNEAVAPFKANGERYAGEKASEFMVYVDTFERLLFGDVYKTTAVNAFSRSKARIAIVHSEDDKSVPISAGYDIYHQEFKNNKRFKFVKLLNHGHASVYHSLEGMKYYAKIHKAYSKYVKDNKPSEIEKEQFLKEHIDRNKYNNMVDKKLIAKLIEFISKK